MQWATTEILALIVSPQLGVSEKVVLTWPLTSWSLTFGHILAKKNTKYRKMYCIFNSKLGPDTALIFRYLDNPMDLKSIYFIRFRTSSGGKLGPKLDQNCKLWVRPAVVKIRAFQKALYIAYILISTNCGPNFSLIGRFLRELLPENLQIWARYPPNLMVSRK